MEGFRLAKALLPDVIVADLAMPFGAGEDLVSALHEDSGTWSIPIIIITGVIDDDRIAQLNWYGIKHILRKPFDFNELQHAVFNSPEEFDCR
jgi:CheY-like chemotaxis protein